MSETTLIEKTEKKELPIVDMRLGEPKLSEMWRRAAKELEQIKWWFGDARRKEACALGAIYFYASNGLATHPLDTSRGMMDSFVLPMSYVRQLEKFEEKVSRVPMLNDEHSWSFERFAEEAEKVGM